MTNITHTNLTDEIYQFLEKYKLLQLIQYEINNLNNFIKRIELVAK